MNMEKTHIPDIQAESVSLMCALAFHIKNMYARKGVAYTGLCTPFLNLYKYSYFSCKGMSHVNNHDLSARYAIQALISNNYKSSSTINTPSKFPASVNLHGYQNFSNLIENKNVLDYKKMNSQRDDYFKNSRHDTASKSVCAFKIKFKSIQKNSYFKNGRHLSVNKSVDLSKLMLNPKQRASTKYEKTSHLYQLFDKGKHSYWHVNKLYKYIRQSGKESDNKKMSITDYASQTHLKREPAFALSQHNYSLNPSISERRNAWLTNKRKSIRLTFSSLKKITEIISSPVANMKMAGIAKVGLSNKQKEKSDTFEENNRMWSDFPLQGKIFRKSSPGNFTDLSDGAVKVTNAFITNSIKGNVVNLLKITEAMKSEIKKELNKTVINNNKQLIKEIHKQSQADAASSVKSITDDSTVRILMEKMRLLDREERFRVGLIK